MSNIGHSKMLRALGRCAETRNATTVDEVISTYDDVLATKAATYESTTNVMLSVKQAYTAARAETVAAVKAIAHSYEVARTVTAVRVPSAELPAALSTLKTDTDKQRAIKRTLDVVNGHRGERWADNVLAGPFGTSATGVIDQITAAVEAAGVLYAAEVAMREALEDVYPAFLGFKAVVRLKLGKGSPEYRRINVRGTKATTLPTPAPTPEPLPVPAPTPEPATLPTNGAGTHTLVGLG